MQYYSFYPKHSSTVLWINFPSPCTRTKSLQNKVEALCWPQQTVDQALVHLVTALCCKQIDSIYQNHIKMHNVTHKHKLFLNIHTQRDIWYLPLNYYWGGGGRGGTQHPQSTHVLLFPWETLLREVLEGASYCCVIIKKPCTVSYLQYKKFLHLKCRTGGREKYY